MIYLLTISCQQKDKYITKEILDDIIVHLEQCGVKFTKKLMAYENHGCYSQLHLHAIVEYDGYYKPLTKYGDEKLWLSFRIQFTFIPPKDMNNFISYIHKQDTKAVLVENYYKNKYFNQSTQLFCPLLLNKKK